MSDIKVIIDEQSFRQAERLLGRLEGEIRRKVIPQALRAASRVAVATMRKLSPDSKKSGSRERWSKKTKLLRVTTKQHRKTIGISTVRKYGMKTALYAGPVHPAGNLINVIGHDHKEMQWGQYTGHKVPANLYVVKAGDQTKRQQQAAFEYQVKRGIIRESLKK